MLYACRWGGESWVDQGSAVSTACTGRDWRLSFVICALREERLSCKIRCRLCVRQVTLATVFRPHPVHIRLERHSTLLAPLALHPCNLLAPSPQPPTPSRRPLPSLPQPPLGTRRTVFLSGMYGAEVVEVIAAYKDAGGWSVG